MLKTHRIQLEIKHRKQEEIERVYWVVCITNALYFWGSLHLMRKRLFTNTGGQPAQFPSDRTQSSDRTSGDANLREEPKCSRLFPAAADTEQRSHLTSSDLATASNCYPPPGHKNELTAADFYFKCSGMLRSRWYRSEDAAGKCWRSI